ncbi:Rft-1-domain-containing protein [Aspergillus campestris IBT 28561]|uniref:Man(5)GlcNAc(2)-PP-dolichol translocation protein RFT1 n=1 Tax=Aspergillus campestris (strain IBT 28561) TaxID=1392248 RepID=A0A2I1CZ36_ASPC2|nr:Rft-1-domain-containing protein [Aspergillus campestris IBT 28561]PKY02897.1 Rft-1-domain-containing protein [Aspergillus campestris IBT 28561]
MAPPEENNLSKLLTSSVSGTSFLIAIQVFSRLFTFVANQLVLHTLSPAILGVATQLELYLISILYFSRESIRVAIQKQPLELHFDAHTAKKKQNDATKAPSSGDAARQSALSSQTVVNMSYLSLGLGIPLALTFAGFYVRFAAEEVSQTPFYRISVAITAVSSLLELSVEPIFAAVQQHMLYKKRAAVEMSAALVKSLVVCGCFTWASWTGYTIGILPFALGHLCYSCTLVFGYIQVTRDVRKQWRFSLLLSRLKSRDQSRYVADTFSCRLLSLSANSFFQSIIKHILTQGDAIILAAMTSLEDQGIYSLACNYGGLVARLLFQPIEESSRILFSSLLNSSESTTSTKAINAAKAHLVDILRGYGMMSALVLPLGPHLVPQMLNALGGHRWGSPVVTSLVSLYCYYIPFLAFNGIIEAFVSGAATPSELRTQTGWMGVFSACFAFAAYFFLRVAHLGAHGLVYANIVNMAVRILWGIHFIRSYMLRNSIKMPWAEFGLRPYTYVAGVGMSLGLTWHGAFGFGIREILKSGAVATGYALLV